MLFDRLANHNGLHNLVWLWEADQPRLSPGGPGALSDFFPGYLYTDALQIKLREADPRLRAHGFLAQFAAGKPIGIELTGDPPSPEGLEGAGWSWFLAAPPSSLPPDPPAQRP